MRPYVDAAITGILYELSSKIILLNLAGVEIFFAYSQCIQSMVSLKHTQISYPPSKHSFKWLFNHTISYLLNRIHLLFTDNNVAPFQIFHSQNGSTNAFGCFVFTHTTNLPSRFEVRKLGVTIRGRCLESTELN